MDKVVYIAQLEFKRVTWRFSCQRDVSSRSSKRVEWKSRPSKPGWKVIPQSRTGSRDYECMVLCSITSGTLSRGVFV